MKIKSKEKAVTSYTIKLSEDEAQDLLSEIVDILDFYGRSGDPDRFATLVTLKQSLQNL